MDRGRQIAAAVRNLVEMPISTFVARVVSVQGETCTVQLVNDGGGGGIELSDVRLIPAIDGGTDKVMLTPVVGAMVLVGSLSGDYRELHVAAIQQVDRLEWRQGQLIIEADTSGLRINNDGENLRQVLNELIAEVQKIVVVVGTTPNVAALEAIKQRLNKILL